MQHSMDCDKLIELVKVYVPLYATDNPKYSDSVYKDNAWRQIGKELNQSVTLCKKTWTSLRDSFRRSLKKRRETKSGQAALKIKKWKFEDQMSFVVPYMQERDTCTNLIDISDDINEDRPNEKEYDDKNEEGGDDRTDDKDDDKDDGIDGEDVNESIIEDEKKKKQKEIKRKVITKVARNSGNKCHTQSESASAVMMKYLLEKKTANARTTPQPSAIDSFFSSIAATVNNFSPYYQNIAKSQIFSIISELEMKQIMQEQPFFVPNTPTQRQHSALTRKPIPLQCRESCSTGSYTVPHPSPSPSPSPSRSPFLSSSTTPTPSPSPLMVPTPTPSPSVYDFPAIISNPHLNEQTPYTEYMKM